MYIHHTSSLTSISCIHHTAGLSSIAVAEMAIRVDRSPPLVSVSGDGDNVMSGDIDYQSSSGTLCVHGTGISDPESGISAILWAAGTHESLMTVNKIYMTAML